jgi:hypothetical protein
VFREDQRPTCTCPEGYSQNYSNNMYGGCIPNLPETCTLRYQGSQNDTYMMMKLPNTYWPNSDYETSGHSSLQEC